LDQGSTSKRRVCGCNEAQGFTAVNDDPENCQRVDGKFYTGHRSNTFYCNFQQLVSTSNHVGAVVAVISISVCLSVTPK